MKLYFFSFALAVTAFLTGCEDNHAPEDFNNTPPASTLKILPSSVSLGPTDTFAVFEASGGSTPYVWSVGDASLGTLPDSTSHLITYTRTGSAFGAHAISVRDANGWTATAEIWQPATTNTP